jgi:hypothetical protein
MPNEEHRISEEAAAAAEGALREGDPATAQSRYLEAAEHELRSASQVPTSQVRTRGILAVSSVSLLVKGEAFERAERTAYGFLTDDDLPAFARDQIRESLEAVWEQRAMRTAGRQYSGQVVSVALRGTEIGSGRAPLGLVVDRILGVNSLLYRITEWLGEFPLRTRGAPPDPVRELCQPWVSEAQAGSYRFELHLVEPTQPELIPTRLVKASDISSLLLNIVRAVSPTTVTPVASIQDLVPDAEYRQAMLKLMRNVVPDGHRVREIEFVAAREGQPETALLHAGARTRIQDSLQADQRANQPDDVSGVLRAVNLDAKWLRVVQPSGQPLRCRIAGEILDDVIGPMLNRQVVVRGKWSSKDQFRLEDIELDSSAEG